MWPAFNVSIDSTSEHLEKIKRFCSDEKMKSKRRWGLFFGANGQAKTGGGVNEIPALTQVELNFLVNVSSAAPLLL